MYNIRNMNNMVKGQVQVRFGHPGQPTIMELTDRKGLTKKLFFVYYVAIQKNLFHFHGTCLSLEVFHSR